MTTKTQPLTDRQREVLIFITDRLQEGICPTIREMCEEFGVSSPNGMTFHLTALERKGYIRIDRKHARSITLVGAKLTLAFRPSAAGRRLQAALADRPPPVTESGYYWEPRQEDTGGE